MHMFPFGSISQGLGAVGEGQLIQDGDERGCGDAEVGLVAFGGGEARGVGFPAVTSPRGVHGRLGFPQVQFVFGQARRRFGGAPLGTGWPVIRSMAAAAQLSSSGWLGNSSGNSTAVGRRSQPKPFRGAFAVVVASSS
jgi:hypothetical protein